MTHQAHTRLAALSPGNQPGLWIERQIRIGTVRAEDVPRALVDVVRLDADGVGGLPLHATRSLVAVGDRVVRPVERLLRVADVATGQHCRRAGVGSHILVGGVRPL